MSKASWVYRLTPGQAWDEFADMSVELFMSLSYRGGYTGITDACTSYSAEVPGLYGRPFPQRLLDHIAGLLEQHIEEYISELGGIDHLEIYTEEELDVLWDDLVADLFSELDKISTAPR